MTEDRVYLEYFNLLSECDQCVTLLLDDIEAMYFDAGDMIDDLTSISVGVTAIRRLKKINDTVTELQVLICNF